MELPPLEEFPTGPRRVVLENLHALYRAADKPGVRTISEGLAQGDFRATMNRDLVAKVLSGRRWPTAWQLDSLVRWLATRAIDVKDPEAESGRLLWLYQQAEAERDGTVRSPAPTRSSILIRSRQEFGLGVLLGDGTVLTRAYVVEENTVPDQERLLVRCVDGVQGPSCPARVTWRSPGYPMGLAVLTSFSLFGLLNFALIPYLLVFFVLAFFTIGSLMMAVGSAVNDMREAQSLMLPMTLLLIVPWILWMPISRDPDSTLSVVVSFLPPVNSFGMLLRLASSHPPPTWQVWLSIAIGVLGVVGAVWFASKVFRIGLLMFGKPPNFGTLVRWVRDA